MFRVPSSVLTNCDNRLVGEASSIGLLPGTWPDILVVQTEVMHPGTHAFRDVNNIYRRQRELQGPGFFEDDVPVFRGHIYVANGLPELYLLND